MKATGLDVWSDPETITLYLAFNKAFDPEWDETEFLRLVDEINDLLSEETPGISPIAIDETDVVSV